MMRRARRALAQAISATRLGPTGRSAVSALALVLVTFLMSPAVPVPVVLVPQPERAPIPAIDSARSRDELNAHVTPADTINGERITDQVLVRRIEGIAARLPAHLLAPFPREAHVRYLAQAFGSGDDAPISQGVFLDSAAALAFGCAVDEELDDRCAVTPVMASAAAYEEIPGVRCMPLRLAFGAPAYEPDRCEAGD